MLSKAQKCILHDCTLENMDQDWLRVRLRGAQNISAYER